MLLELTTKYGHSRGILTQVNRLARNSVTLGRPLASQLGRSRSGATTSCYNSVMGFHLAIKLNTKYETLRDICE